MLVGKDPNEIYRSFPAEYHQQIDDCFPHKTIRRSPSGKPKSPWTTKGLLASVRKKNKMYKKYLAIPTPARGSHYKRYKNK